MGLCDPKEIRKGAPWYQAVNQPGFMRGKVSGDVSNTAQSPTSDRDNKNIETAKQESTT